MCVCVCLRSFISSVTKKQRRRSLLKPGEVGDDSEDDEPVSSPRSTQ